MKEMNELIEEYYKWLRNKAEFNISQETGWVQMSTPFLGLFNDNIEIYAKRTNGKILLSDDGLTLNNLDLVGAAINRSQKRHDILDKILLNYGITLSNDELQVESSEKDFPQKKHNLISAISEINDMFMLAKNTVTSVFKEDVQSYLEDQNVIYTPEFIARGSTGLEFTFDFHIAHRKHEIVLKAFNTISTFNLSHFLFAWQDIKEVRGKITGKEISGLAIINDAEKPVKTEFSDAIKSKNAGLILWSDRFKPENVKMFAA